jgi:2C-methyl-D-erythritol 2,4-cyclodiphosphate synthase
MERNLENEISKRVIEVLGIDLFKNTRKREYSDGRVLLVKILHDSFNMGWSDIAKYFTEKGKPVKSHASIIHLHKQFPIVEANNLAVRRAHLILQGEYVSISERTELAQRIMKIKSTQDYEVVEKIFDTLNI